MRTLLFLVAAVVITSASIALAPTASWATCQCTIGLTAECHDGCVLLNWNIGCPQDCSATVTSLQRKCGNGSWVNVTSNPSCCSYSDCAVPSSCLDGYTYRLVWTESCTPLTLCTTESNVVYCP